MMTKKLEIIATLGPSVSDKISDLVDSGATALRLNCSHLILETITHWLVKIEKTAKRNNQIIPLWLDLQGTKLRIGRLIRPMKLEKDKSLTFVHSWNQLVDEIPLPHKEIFNLIQIGDKIWLDDGRIILMVESVEPDKFTARLLNSGKLSSFKGFSKRAHNLQLQDVFSRDLSFIEYSRNYDYIGYAISYIQSTEEIQLVKKHIYDKPVIAKIERLKSFDNLKEIARCADGVWLCRGDLGVEANIYNLYHFEKVFIQQLARIDKPFLIAGQVLENMVKDQHPSRSEVSHLGYLIENGFSGVVLSDETAIGKYPIQAVKFCREYFDFLSKAASSNL